MKIQYVQKEVFLGNQKYFCLTVDTVNLYSCEFDKNMYMVFGDQRALQELACIFLLASQNRDKIIYLRHTDKFLPEDLHSFSTSDRNDELVLLHHSLQANTGLWKDLRERFRTQKGNKKSYTCNPRRFADLGHDNYQKFAFAENKDKILVKSKYETLFLIGSKSVFEVASGLFEPLSRAGAGEYRRNGGHAHVHLDIFTGKHQGLCVDYYDKALWNKK